MNDVAKFYDQMSSCYHLIATGWDDEVRKQGKILRTLLSEKFGTSPGAKILDCSCGIGTQAIGLALEGYQVVGSDISAKEIDRARDEAKRLNAKVDFKVSDFLSLGHNISGQFDAVIAFDNAIAHLTDTDELKRCFASMLQKLKPGGVLLVSARDYDQLRAEKPTGTMPKLIEDEFVKRIYFQTWVWNESGSGYSVNLFVLRPSASIWAGEPLQTQMRAFTANEITSSMTNAGFKKCMTLETSESKYYQPVFVATAP